MKKYLLVLLSILAFISCKENVASKKASEVSNVESSSQITEVKTYNYVQLKPLLEKEDEKTYVVNFWATWCAPCVKELPYFEKINEEYKNQNVEVILVSLDFPKQVEKKLIPFINRKKLQSEVILLDDTNENVWINAIDESWSGAIPATLIYNKKQRKFYEQSFEYENLENELKSFLNI